MKRPSRARHRVPISNAIDHCVRWLVKKFSFVEQMHTESDFKRLEPAKDLQDVAEVMLHSPTFLPVSLEMLESLIILREVLKALGPNLSMDLIVQ